MQENKQKKKKSKMDNFIEEWFSVVFIFLGLTILLITLKGYLDMFGNYLISSNTDLEVMYKESIERFGQFGDFIGGTLNPTFAFLSFMAILWTLKIQIKALNTSQEELELSRDELSKSSKALEEQSKSIKIQNFENTFFNMINLHKEIISNLSLMKSKKDWEYGGKSFWAGTKQSIPEKDRVYLYTILEHTVDIEENSDLYGKKVISKLFEILNCYIKKDEKKNLTALYDSFYKEYNEMIGHYFRNIYHILKFIKKTSEKNEIELDSKFYTNILRAQLSNSELALLFLNALSKYGKKELLPLLIEYEFMEPLPMSIIDNSYLKKILELCDDPKIFGQSEEWKEYINSINTSSQEQQ